MCRPLDLFDRMQQESDHEALEFHNQKYRSLTSNPTAGVGCDGIALCLLGRPRECTTVPALAANLTNLSLTRVQGDSIFN